MNKIYVLFTLIIMSNLSLAQDEKLVGTWVGNDKEGILIKFIFDDEGYVTMVSDGVEFGGKKFDVNGISASMKYKTDQSVNPHKVNYLLKDLSGEYPTTTMGGVYQYINDNSIKFRINPNLGESYDRFVDEVDEDTFILKKE
ncbi:hypothetical protein [Paenimyroides viscosum]|uniref:DUF2147 domain-containing protein n=1 Tax=Paenimyroides viscosum TaxID=2488729 RepID=A0A3P1B5T2_9FLAO|nr:hypothetical protein [Paenimyroides viscosum]RRA96466.1 hypothetical protein EG242_02390 [Paenimyroides viscosum]